MRPRYFALLAALSLAGCINTTALTSSLGSHNVQVHYHSTFPASGVAQTSITNVTGSIRVTAWDRPNVDVSAVIYGADQAAVGRTQVVATRNGSEIEIETKYDRSGFFGNQNGGEVDYIVRVPKTVSVSVTNVSGPTTLTGLAGDVDATEVSGRLEATLGRLTGTRRIQLTAISGRITARIARTSDARVDASTLSGSVDLFFPSDSHEGMVGNSATGRIGKATSSMTLHTVSGSIAVEPE
jgi:DUF4097 and DUF4098 domain-containing protein YvlB